MRGRDPVSILALTTLAVILVASLFGPLMIAAESSNAAPYSIDLERRLQPPDANHFLGTDELGRDVLLRLLHGGRVSLAVGFISAMISFLIGVFLGAWGGWLGGWVDRGVMRLVELAMCFPFYFLALAIVAVMEPSITALIVALSITTWTTEARLVRGEVLRLRSSAMVEAARSTGASSIRILMRHVLPNAITPAIVAATFGVAGAIMAEAALSFLGFGVPLPASSWGTMLASADDHLGDAWWLAVFPGAAVIATVASVQILGERLRRIIAVDEVPLRLR